MKKRMNCLAVGAFALALLFGAFGPLQANAQTAFKAKLDKTSGVISLDETAAVGYLYQLDFTSMNFTTRETAEAFFGPLNTDLVTFQVNFDKRSANLFLNLRDKTQWTVKDWNAYLATLTKK